MTERMEPPAMLEGYGVSLADNCMLDVVKSVRLVIDTEEEERREAAVTTDLATVRQLVRPPERHGPAPGRRHRGHRRREEDRQGHLRVLQRPQLRDSYIAAMYKASLSPHYTLSVFKATPNTQFVSSSP